MSENPFAKLAANRNPGRVHSRSPSQKSQKSEGTPRANLQMNVRGRNTIAIPPSPARSTDGADSSVTGTQYSSPRDTSGFPTSSRRLSRSEERPPGRPPASSRTPSNTARVGGRPSLAGPPRRLRRAATNASDVSDLEPLTPEKVAKKIDSMKISEEDIKPSTNENGRSEPISPPSHEWHPGSKAMAQNLQQDKHLNGKMCTVEKVCERGYVHVFFDDVELQRNGNKGKWKLSGKNLMPVMAMFDDDSEDEGQFGSDDESDDEEVIQKMNEIENAPTKAGEKTGSSLEVSVRCSPKKTDIMSLPKIGRKMGKKAHLWAVTVGNETFYARRTALVKCKLIKNKELTHGKIKKKITKRLQEAGETRGKAMMQLAERITFQEQNANLWVMMHFGSLF